MNAQVAEGESVQGGVTECNDSRDLPPGASRRHMQVGPKQRHRMVITPPIILFIAQPYLSLPLFWGVKVTVTA
jgi:hypothetical protein